MTTDAIEKLKIKVECLECDLKNASAAANRAAGERDALRERVAVAEAALTILKEAVEYTPLGIRGIKAVELTRAALSGDTSALDAVKREARAAALREAVEVCEKVSGGNREAGENFASLGMMLDADHADFVSQGADACAVLVRGLVEKGSV